MSEKSDPALTEYTRMRIHELKRDGWTQEAIEQKTRIARGYVSQILSGKGGMGPKNGERIYAIFGFASYPELVIAAHKWWVETGKAIHEKVAAPEKHMDPERARAVRAARAGGATEAAINAALEDFKHIEGRDWGWWVMQISERAKAMEHAAIGEARAGKKAHATRLRRRRKVREVAERLAEAKGASAPFPAAEPTPASDRPAKKRRVG